MKKLLDFELRKLFRQKSLYICTGITIGLSVFTLIVLYIVARMGAYDDGTVSVVSGIGSLTTLDGLVGALSNGSFGLLLCIVISIFVCADYSLKTVRNVLGKGYSNTEIMFSKYIASVVAAIFMMLVTWLIVFLFSSILFHDFTSYDAVRLPWDLLGQVFVVVGMTSLFFMFAIVTKKLAAAIALGIVFSSTLATVLQLANVLLQHLKIDIDISGISIDNHMTNLSMFIDSMSELRKTCFYGILAGLIYALICLLLSWLANRNFEG